MLSNIFDPALGRDKTSKLVPFVYDEDTRFKLVVDVVRKLLVDLAHRFGTIEKQQYNIRSSYASLSSVQTVPIDVRPNAFVTTKPRSVDRHEFVAVKLEHHVDTIASRSGDLADNASILFHERIDESAFADIASPNNRNLHRRRFDFTRVRIKVRQVPDDPIKQIGFVAILQYADSHQVLVTELMKLIRV